MAYKPYPNTEKPVLYFEDIDTSLTYNYSHYLNWLFDDRVELIKGQIFKMSPAPSPYHQQISIRISSELYMYLKDKVCKVYTAPFDVRFPKESKADKDVYTVLQPDICVICDLNKIDNRGCIGAPDIVVEILSPGNNKTELLNKYSVYEEFGVKEYWVVSPAEKTFLKYTLDENGKYQPSKLFTLSERIYSDILPEFVLDLDEIFED
ncbi:MAG TPA: Uma2 family endonuclease [Pedobacter sp.]|jgi:Uma2 family endonuclease